MGCQSPLGGSTATVTQKARYKAVTDYFLAYAPNAETELIYDNPFQLLVAVILSAQCTDKRINLTTPALFAQYPTPEAMAAADYDSLFPYLKSISYPSNKTKHLLGMAQMLVQQFNSTVPLTVEQLVTLPGVGRKTANVITSVIDNQPNMAVDTHVFRVSARLGLTKKATTPLAAEKQLIKHFEPQYVHKAHHWLILHGRYVCTARSPQCTPCRLNSICPYFAKSQRSKQ